VELIPATPMSHLGDAYFHVETFHEKNLLAQGQSIEGIDDAIEFELRTGQFSCHHERIVHSSKPNETDALRIGLGLFYIPTHVRPTSVDAPPHWSEVRNLSAIGMPIPFAPPIRTKAFLITSSA